MTATGPELGASGVAVADEEPRRLAVATVWFVVLPVLDKPRPPAGACGTFIVSKSGSARCVGAPTPATQSPSAQPSTPWP